MRTSAGCGNFPAANANPASPSSNASSAKSARNWAWTFPSANCLRKSPTTIPDKSVHLKFFRCRLLSGEPQALDCAAVKWIGKSELDEHEFPSADARLIEKLKTEPDGEY